MADVLTIDDLITDRKHSTFFAEVVTGKTGGLSTGADIATATNQVTGQVQKTVPAIAQTVEDAFAARVAGMAFTRVGTFTAGATLTDMRQTLIWEVSQGGDGHEYGWSGAFPKVVPPGSTPATTGGIGAGAWVDRSDVTLRSELESSSGSDLVGIVNSEVGAVQRTVTSKFDGYITPEDFGFDNTSVGDQAAELQAAIYAAANSGKTLIANRSVCYVASRIIIPPTLNANWNGFKIKKHSSFSGSSVVSVEKGASTTTWSKAAPLENIVVEGTAGNIPDLLETVDGVYIGGAGMQTSDTIFTNVKISGFRDCLVFKGPSTYLLTFVNPQIGVANRRGVSYEASVDSGENIRFFGGSIYNCVNGTFDSVGFYNSPTSSTIDIRFYGTSFDYNDIDVNQAHSTIELYGCHNENGNNSEKFIVGYTGGKAKPKLKIIGGTIGGGPMGAGPFGNTTEDSNGRPYYIKITGQSATVIVDRAECGKYLPSGQKTQIVYNSSGLEQDFIAVNPILDASRLLTGSVPCAIYNGQNNFYVEASGSTTGWTSTGGSGNTWSADATTFVNYDTGSRKLTTTGAASSGSIYQAFPVKYGDKIVLKAWVKTSGLTSGYCAIRTQFYAWDGTTLISDSISDRKISSDSSSFAEISTYLTIPNGATSLRVHLYQTNLPATPVTVWWSGERAWLIK